MKRARTTSPLSAAAPPARRRRAVQMILILAGVFMFVESLVGDKGLFAMRKARAEYDEVARDTERLKAENASSREMAEHLRHDAATIEDAARRELGLIKPGEKLFIIKDVPAAGTRPARK